MAEPEQSASMLFPQSVLYEQQFSYSCGRVTKRMQKSSSISWQNKKDLVGIEIKKKITCTMQSFLIEA